MSTPVPLENAHLYRSRRRQVLIAAGMVAMFIALWSQTQQPDYETHIRPKFSGYVWELAPFLALTVVMAVRAFRVRTVTDSEGVHLSRVLTNEFHPWVEVTGIEVHPTPTHKLLTVKLRLDDRRTVKVTSFRVAKRDAGRSPDAEALAERLRGDLQRWGRPVGSTHGG